MPAFLHVISIHFLLFSSCLFLFGSRLHHLSTQTRTQRHLRLRQRRAEIRLREPLFGEVLEDAGH